MFILIMQLVTYVIEIQMILNVSVIFRAKYTVC